MTNINERIVLVISFSPLVLRWNGINPLLRAWEEQVNILLKMSFDCFLGKSDNFGVNKNTRHPTTVTGIVPRRDKKGGETLIALKKR
jgi:hypothetical protein